MGSGYLTTIRRRKRVNITQQSTNIGVGLGLIMEKRGQVCALTPKKIRFAVAEFDVDEDFAIEHDLILWLGKVMNDRSSGKKHLFKCKFG